MGVEKSQLDALNAWSNGESFEVFQGSSVNQKLLTVCLIFLKALTSGSPTDIAQAAREFRTRIEQQIGTADKDGTTERRGGAGLYAFPAKVGGLADEARTTSHYHLHLAWLSAGLWACRRALRGDTGPNRGTNSPAQAAPALLEIKILYEALCDWLWAELSWSHVCWVPGIGALSPCRRHRRGKDHSLVLTSPDRDNLYRLLVLGGDGIDPKYRKQAARTQNEQQVGFRLMAQLLETGDPGLLEVARRIKTGELAEVRFWDRLDVARQGNQSLVAWVNYERKGQDDTMQVIAKQSTCDGPPTIMIDEPRNAGYQPNEPAWTRTTFHSSREEASQ